VVRKAAVFYSFFIFVGKMSWILFLILDKWIRPLSSGGPSGVSIIRHLASGRILVWKKVPIRPGEKREHLNELEIALLAKCEYVVPILDWFEEDGCLFIVMEFYEGGTLCNLYEDLKTSSKRIEESVYSFFLSFLIFICFSHDLLFFFLLKATCTYSRRSLFGP
jgi:serine/threonine protein kinase